MLHSEDAFDILATAVFVSSGMIIFLHCIIKHDDVLIKFEQEL